jgi:hypothetical protein
MDFNLGHCEFLFEKMFKNTSDPFFMKNGMKSSSDRQAYRVAYPFIGSAHGSP